MNSKRFLEIPEGWKSLHINEIARTEAGGTPSTFEEEYWKDGLIPWLNSGAVQNCVVEKPSKMITKKGLANSAAKLLPKNTVLIALTGATTGKVGFLPFESSTNQSVVGILPSDKHWPKYLYYFLIYIRNQILRYSVGSAQPHINKNIVDTLRVVLPPISEQQKIASILSTVDNAIQKTDGIIRRAEMLKRGLLQRLLTRGIGHTRFKHTELGEIPETWEVKEYSKLCSEITIGIVRSLAKYYVDSGVPCLRCLNILENKIDTTDLVFISQGTSKLLSKSVLREGDVVTRQTGKPGISAVIPKAHSGVNCIDLIISRPKKEINPHFLSIFLNSNFAKRQIVSWQSGSMQQHLNVGIIKKLKILAPSRSEQDKIVSVMKICERILTTEHHLKERIEQLMKGLMQDLLTGRVRVKVD